MKITHLNTKSEEACPSSWTSYNSYFTGGQATGCIPLISQQSSQTAEDTWKGIRIPAKTMDRFYSSAYACMEEVRVTDLSPHPNH